jgi:hypothetical protein
LGLVQSTSFIVAKEGRIVLSLLPEIIEVGHNSLEVNDMPFPNDHYLDSILLVRDFLPLF